MISITTTTVRTNRVVILRNIEVASDIQNSSARISKTKTLDGGNVVIHNGFVESDRRLSIQARAGKTVSDNLWELFTTQTFVNVAIKDGVFSAVIASLNIDGGNIKASIELASELT